jgi:hypothetical protein
LRSDDDHMTIVRLGFLEVPSESLTSYLRHVRSARSGPSQGS